MQRISKEDRRTKSMDSEPLEWRKIIANHKADREAYVMMVSDNDPVKYEKFMRSSCSVFLTALESFARRIESQEEQKNKPIEPVKRK